jgi:hypothetical protein
MMDVPMKKCSECKQLKPATAEYFHKNRSLPGGFHYWCKVCFLEDAERKRRAKGIPKKHYRSLVDGNLRCSVCHSWKPATTDFFYADRSSKTEFSCDCKDCKTKANEKRRRLKGKRIRNTGRDRAKEALNVVRRRARKRNLPDHFTRQDWQRCLEYFNHCCAICGRQLKDLFGTHTAAADHWVPLTSPDCPGTVPTNIVPMCHGIGGCNPSKAANNAEQWLIKRFGKRKAKKKLAEIEAYFEWLKTNPR